MRYGSLAVGWCIVLLGFAPQARALSLEPIPWIASGVGDLDGGDAGRFSQCFETFFFPGGCGPLGAPSLEGGLPPDAAVVVEGSQDLILSANVISTVNGSQWMFGVENVSLSGLPDPPFEFDDVSKTDFSASLWVFASFVVPDSGQPVTPVAFQFGGDTFVDTQFLLLSGMLGPSGSRGLGPVEVFLPGDTVTLFTEIPFAVHYTGEGAAPELTFETACGSGFPPHPGPDCLLTVDIGQPLPEPVLLGLLAMGLAAFRVRRPGIR